MIKSTVNTEANEAGPSLVIPASEIYYAVVFLVKVRKLQKTCVDH